LNGTDDVEISFFRNKEQYESFAVRQKGETVKGKYEKGDSAVPEVEITKKKSGEIDKDYFEVNKFYQDEMVALGERLRANPAPAVKKVKKEESNDYKDLEDLEDSEAIPF
jgi:hypothetical protein